MTPDKKIALPYVLIVTQDGKEVEAGRYRTESQAADFAERYGITEWHVERRPRSGQRVADQLHSTV